MTSPAGLAPGQDVGLTPTAVERRIRCQRLDDGVGIQHMVVE